MIQAQNAGLPVDLGYVEAALEELQTYLLSDELYGSLRGYPSPGQQPYFLLTLGGVLLALQRCRARVISGKDVGRVENLGRQLETIYLKWRVAWEAKAAWEFGARARQWGNFLAEVQRDPGEHAPYYPYEVRLRAMLELLGEYPGEITAAELDLLRMLDRRLRARFEAGDFIWDADLREGFPQDIYWFLWGQLSVVGG